MKIRQAEFPDDKLVVLDLLRANLPTINHELRFDWLYLQNPSGRAVTYLATDEAGVAVGLASVFPKSIWINGNISVCGQVGDFAVDLRNRTLGPAVQLQKATFDVVTRHGFTFVYDSPPHEKGMSTFVRLGMGSAARMKRFARLLRTDRQFKKLLKFSVLSRPTSSIANVVLSSLANKRRAKGIHISEHTGRFGEEFSALDIRIGNVNGIRRRRFAEDLCWRYSEDPTHSYRCLVARSAGELVGYVIIESGGADCELFELSAIDLNTIGPYLMDSIVSVESSRSQTIQAWVSSSYEEMIVALKKGGFKYRSEGKMIVPFLGDVIGGNRSSFPNRWLFQAVDVAG